MNHTVVLTRIAERQLDSVADWYAAQDLTLGENWFNGIHVSLASLSENPERFGFAHENDDFPCQLREMLYGIGRRKTHRVLFVIREDQVVIHQIRHVAQRDFMSDV